MGASSMPEMGNFHSDTSTLDISSLRGKETSHHETNHHTEHSHGNQSSSSSNNNAHNNAFNSIPAMQPFQVNHFVLHARERQNRWIFRDFYRECIPLLFLFVTFSTLTSLRQTGKPNAGSFSKRSLFFPGDDGGRGHPGVSGRRRGQHHPGNILVVHHVHHLRAAAFSAAATTASATAATHTAATYDNLTTFHATSAASAHNRTSASSAATHSASAA